MFMIIGGDGREYGPSSVDQIRDWIGQNRANAQTLVRRPEQKEWVALGSLPEFVDALAARAAPPVAAEDPPSTGGAFSRTVPTAPTPPPAAVAGPEEFAANCLGRPSEINLGAAWGRGFDVVARNFWLTVGGTFVVTICAMAVGLVPLLGTIANLLLNQVFYGGLFFFFMLLLRGQPAALGDAFAGFSRAFVPLMLLSLVMTLLQIAAAIPAILAFVSIAFEWAPPGVGILLGLVLLLPMIYLVVSWIFAPMLVIDRGMDFWPAMELSRKMVGRHWFLVFIFLVVTAILVSLGLLALIVGIFVTMAFGAGATVALYEQLFRSETDGK
jgi:hypothetical protein